MAKDYRRLWRDLTNTIDEAKAVRLLAEILADKEGRVYISRLERKDAEVCIEVLDHVSCVLLCSPFVVSVVSAGYRVAQPQTHREAGFLRHIEETCRVLWTTPRFDDDTGKD